jgi:glycosyltransferase involved in cell wall biosynthesis
MLPSKPGVLMVTGAYYPELSGAGLQCRSLVRQLAGDVDFTVLTTTIERSMAGSDTQDGVPVHRVFIDPKSLWSKAVGTVTFARVFLRERHRWSIVHLHGFSQKSILLMALARLTGSRVAIKLTSIGHDDPLSMKRRGSIAYGWYSRSDMFFAVSPRFVRSYEAAGLPTRRLRLIPNGVDCSRFRPPLAGERDTLRRALSLPEQGPLVLFVGFFSREKRPDLLSRAWSRAAADAGGSSLVFVGATRSSYYEVDRDLADDIRREAGRLGLEDRLRFVERTDEIERFYRAADVFVLSSVREGSPNALLEAMASGAACVATRLEGVTDAIVEHGRNGLLVPPDDETALADALRQVLKDSSLRSRLSAEARRTIESRYALPETAGQYLDAYRSLEIAGTPAGNSR